MVAEGYFVWSSEKWNSSHSIHQGGPLSHPNTLKWCPAVVRSSFQFGAIQFMEYHSYNYILHVDNGFYFTYYLFAFVGIQTYLPSLPT